MEERKEAKKAEGVIPYVDCILTGRVTERTENMRVEEGGRTYSTRVSP